MPRRLTDTPSAPLLSLIVISMSSPAATTLADACACVASLVETLLAVPPSGVPLIETVTVQVPAVDRVVTLVIVTP